MRFINSKIHGLLDYAAAVALIVAPFILDLRAESLAAHWISVVAGVGLVVYSMMTNYHFGIAKLIPFKLHLGLDTVAAVFFLLAPSILGFEGIVQIYYYVMGAGVLMVIALTSAADSRQQSERQIEANA